MNSETHQLTSAIRAGDAAAFTRFYQQWYEPMLAMARSGTGRDESFCMDVVQDAMVRVIRSLPVLEAPEALRAWIRKATLSAAHDLLRKEARLRRRSDSAAPAGDSSKAQDDDRLAWLRDELAAMEPQMWNLLWLRFGKGWTLAEIGIRFGMKPGAVDGRLGRSIKALRERAPQDRGDS